jgi:hypothetical protein
MEPTIRKYTEPFNYIVIDNFIPIRQYNLIKEMWFENRDKINDFQKNSKTLSDDNIPTPGVNLFHSDTNLGLDILLPYIEKLDIKIPDFEFQMYPEVSISSFLPHTDDAMSVYNMKQVFTGIVKGLFYIGDEELEYDNLGTVFYSNETKKICKEVEFVPNRLLLFDVYKDSWHGTNFFNEFSTYDIGDKFRDNHEKNCKIIENSYRYTFNIEYICKSKILGSEVFDNINYGIKTDYCFDMVDTFLEKKLL